MGTRIRDSATVLPLLLAILFAGLAPHLHAPAVDAGDSRSAAMIDSGLPQAPLPAEALEPAECPACRSAQSMRLAIAQDCPRPLPQAPQLRERLRDDCGRFVALLVRTSAPPRAPPV